MTDSSDPSFAPPGSGTSPDAIAKRTFSQTKRGYSESEVRAYLRMLADDLAGAAARERELAARVRELEGQLHKPSLPPSEHDLIALLGEETARVLGQARESAVELRGKAEEHARRVVREAQETARELRSTTQHAVEAKTREAEDAARARAKEIVGDARALRERVLNDLNERRQQLERQIADLRAGRGQLVESYQLVERALTHATRLMAEEPSAAPDVPAPPVQAGDDVAEAGADVPSAPPPPPDAKSDAKSDVADGAEAVEKVDAAPVATVEVAGPDVGALFEKLRSEHTEGAPAPDTASDAAEAVGAATPDAADLGKPDEPSGEQADATPTSEDGSEGDADLGPDRAATEARDAALAATTGELVRRAKRTLQDEQNDILDGLRRQRGKIDTAKVLPTLEDHLARWAHVLQPAVDDAYSAGATSANGAVDTAPSALLAELSTITVTPLRDRLSSSIESIDARTPADTEIAVAQRLGARYREWRAEELETVLGDALAAAYARGVYDAAPDGARLRWIPTHEGKCPDCDDNALEPTVKSNEFPTGQPHPPAHPGCRCLLVVEDAPAP